MKFLTFQRLHADICEIAWPEKIHKGNIQVLFNDLICSFNVNQEHLESACLLQGPTPLILFMSAMTKKILLKHSRIWMVSQVSTKIQSSVSYAIINTCSNVHQNLSIIF